MAKLAIYRVPLNRGGYTKSGRYYGVGAPLYEWDDEDGKTHYTRAGSRAEAKLIFQAIRDKQARRRQDNGGLL